MFSYIFALQFRLSRFRIYFSGIYTRQHIYERGKYSTQFAKKFIIFFRLPQDMSD